MKLSSLHIENFGRFHDFNYVFKDGLNVIMQENGWGKTTLAVFIKAMFYGMDKKGNLKSFCAERSKYLPWQGGVYGGSLIFQVNDKTYRVLRTFGLTPEGDRFELLDLGSNKLSKDYSYNLGEELFGVGKNTFSVTTFFPQGEIEGEINDEIRSYLTGAYEMEGDVENHSKAIKKIKETIKALSVSSPKNFDILEIEGEIKVKEEQAQNLSDNRNDLKQKISETSNYIQNIKNNNDKSDCNFEDVKTNLNDINFKINTIEDILKVTKKRYILFLFLFSFSLILSFALIISGLLVIIFNNLVALGTILSVLGSITFVFILVFLLKFLKFKNERLVKLKKEKENLYTEKNSYDDTLFSIVEKSQNSLSSLNEKVEFEKENAVLETKLAHIENDLEKTLEFIGNYEDKLNLLKIKKQDVENKILIANKTIEFLEQAQINISQRFVKPMQEKFSKIIKKVAEDLSIRLDSDFKLSTDTQIGIKEKEYLSRGKQDIVLICRRFALIESIFKKEVPFIILDDPFINLDDKSVKNMIDLLKTFSKDNQIIYFVCHSSRS